MYNNVLELRIETHAYDLHCLQRHRSSSEKGPKISGLPGDSKPDLCDAGALLHQLRYHVTWELVVMWIDDHPWKKTIWEELEDNYCY